jgi:NADH:ubiquinone oxidoreductase subunit F (NADH-binding)/NAD-dependent dihydropyrimidine dehydrogenase PreA subunit
VEKITALAGDIEIKTGQDSLVCRDKTALVAALNGEYIRPFFVNDENDLVFDGALVTKIVTIEDAVNFGEGKITKTFYIHGAVKNSCFVRFPWGTPLQTIIDAAGCIKNGEEIKAVLIGGILGKLVSPQDIESVVPGKENHIFSGSIEVFDKRICGVDVTRAIINSCRTVSCGKCPLCREGTHQLFSAFSDITNGKGKSDTLTLIKEMSANIALGAFCQFGKNMAEFVNSALDVFKNEIEDHVKRKKCSSLVCKAFMNLIVLPDKCTGCGKCLDVCDDDSIEGKKGYIHMIHDEDCVKCGKCIEVCEEQAIVFASGVKLRMPKRLTRVGQFIQAD